MIRSKLGSKIEKNVSLNIDRSYLVSCKLQVEERILNIKKAIMAHCLERNPDDYIDYYNKHFSETSKNLTAKYLDPIITKITLIDAELRNFKR